MSIVSTGAKGETALLMGNDAIARGALEAGVRVIAGYPGTPSSEIIQTLAGVASDHGLYVEWSANEKVGLEVAAAGSFAQLRSMAVMKQVGVNVASDFLLHLAECGTRAGLVLLTCEDPGGLSSTNEGDSRHYAKMMEFPLVEPGNFQEAKDMAAWSFELSEKVRNVVMFRSVTRMSHASGNVVLGELSSSLMAPGSSKARFQFDGDFMDQMRGPVVTFPGMVDAMHRRQLEKLALAREIFETSPFNIYTGPDRPELLVITSSAAYLYTEEAIALLGLEERVGLLKLGTTWPLPPRLLSKHLKASGNIFIIEEGMPFLEDNVKALWTELGPDSGSKQFFGRKDGPLPPTNELNPDLVAGGLASILGLPDPWTDQAYSERAVEIAKTHAPFRAMTFCPGCPHRASYWLINSALKQDNRHGFVCGDIGCYTMGAISCGFNTLKTSHAMGSGTGLASGFGKLNRFGFDQPVMAVSGDSTFFHAVMPALVNAVHNQADIILVVVDNSGTAMTGFQPHPGTVSDAGGGALPALDIARICQAMDIDVAIADPFEMASTEKVLLELLDNQGGVRVLILRQACALSPEKKGKRLFDMTVDEASCLAEDCGCNRLCTRIFGCPGLIWDPEAKRTRIDEVICVGCGVCASICPTGAISKKEVA
ncbi:MAG: indolepyruvate ferredoxin oxidoreductase subunit alpha [Deltaproteobacteria bacterium]|jgi:indolepyruvate ferredoxin oxidoreductase, alpha subunit|nr:indolepyruvate ferredoxin oxidoreductase subunit alpha [Deltaproteobacteria bacterium]